MSFNAYYRVSVVTILTILVLVFSAADDGYCTTIAAMSVGKDEAHNCLEFWLERYQGLIGAITTLAAALIALLAVKGQVDQIERHAKDKGEREADAARAVLPLSLSAICDYAVQCMKALEDTSTPDTAVVPWPTYSAPAFPSSVIPTLQDGVRHSDRQRAKQITDLLAAAQIQTARMRDLTETLDTANSARYRNLHIQNGIFDAADLYARAAPLFEFARSSYDRRSTPVSNIRNALKISMLIEEEYPWLVKRLASLEAEEMNEKRHPVP